MKKWIIALVIIILIIVLIPSKEQEFRIRVIANSNSKIDQEIKMKVVSAITDEIKKFDSESIESEINKNFKNIDEAVKKTLGSKKYQIAIKKTYFPPKELNGNIIKGGKYRALIIIIEAGEGKNWWSLLCPSYNIGFEDQDSKDVEFKFYFIEEIKKCFK